MERAGSTLRPVTLRLDERDEARLAGDAGPGVGQMVGEVHHRLTVVEAGVDVGAGDVQ